MLDIEVKDELVEIITQIRLGAYGDDDNSILLKKYIYNLKLSEAFLSCLVFIRDYSSK